MSTRQRSGYLLRLVIIAVASFASPVHAQPFRNLGFEESPFPPDSGRADNVPIALLFPGWTVRFGESIATTGTLNQVVAYGPSAALFTSTTPSMQGHKTLLLGAWLNNLSASIAQIGDVPTVSRSVRFMAGNEAFARLPETPGPFRLRMNLETVPLIILSQSGGDFIYGADISAWAGSTSELQIEITTYGLPGYTGSAFIDNIEFSPDPIPEPGALAGLATVVTLLVRRRERHRV